MPSQSPKSAAPRPLPAGAGTQGAGSAAGAALLAYASTELEQAMRCFSWCQARRHEGVHLGRKSVRRVRATLALASARFGRASAFLDRELQRINRSLSALRDGQALVEALDRLAGVEESAPHVALLRRARRCAVQRRAALGRAPANVGTAADEPGRIIAVLLAAIPALPWAELTGEEVLAALEQGRVGAQAAGQRALERGREEDWHRWRRRARRLSQQARAVTGAVTVAEKKENKELAVRLGEAQDFSLLLEHCGKDSPFAAPDRHLLRALAKQRLDLLRAGLQST